MPRELDACVRQVRASLAAKGKKGNAFAICRGSLGSDAAIKQRRTSKLRKTLERA